MATVSFVQTPCGLPLIAFFVACIAAIWLHPKIVKVAQLKGITDNPDKRKLQRQPVPVLGGVVVFFAIVLGMGLVCTFAPEPQLMFFFALMMLMLYVGTMDDIMGLTPKLRFLIEILAALAVIFLGKYQIDNFHGLWGIFHIPAWISIPLTVVTIVGIINSINLIDGVNGLSSGYCIMACAIFGAYFFFIGDTLLGTLAVACIGGLIPFFVHNVFGHRLRMFIGDGGTLMMGMILSLFVLRVLHVDAPDVASEPELVANADKSGFGLIPFTLSILSIPVCDTLRVMTRRILRGTSPFYPDKTHLHHAFIDLGCSHLQTTLCILTLNLAIVGLWYTLHAIGASLQIQVYAVAAAAVTTTCGFALLAKYRTADQ